MSRNIIAILRGILPDEAVKICEAILEAGIDRIEVPLNSPRPFDSIAAIVGAIGRDALIGAGTVVSSEDVVRVYEVGGELVVSPDCNPGVIRKTKELGMASFPGVFTATECFTALREGDLIKGAFNRSSVGTLVKRKTRFVVLCRMRGNGAEAVLDSFTRQMKRMPAVLRRSMTYDRGSEMACHPELARRLKIDIWFCDSHAPWQRGSNENTNGLLRQFMPKGTDLGDASQTWLNDVAALLNNRPRKTLG